MRGQEVELAVNYSKASAALLRSRRIRIDRFKCPAWPTLVREVQAIHPLYVHLPLRVGVGTGEVVSVEAPGVPDWAEIEDLLALTGTPFVNVHLTPTVGDHPDIPRDTQEPAHVEQVAEAMLKDLRAVVARFGRDRVIAENNPLIAEAASTPRSLLRPAALPQVIRYVVETAGCGLLLDLAHVRLAASGLGMDPRAYLGLLPVDRIRELHVTGVQPLAGHWLDRLHRTGIADHELPFDPGTPMDHLPLTGPDWTLVEWAMAQVHAGKWANPALVSFEYGGVGTYWEALTVESELEEQVPRLYRLVHGGMD